MTDILKPLTGGNWFAIEGNDHLLSDELRHAGIRSGTDSDRADLLALPERYEMPDENDARDAAASQMMRLIQEDDEELARISDAEAREVELICKRYEEILAPIQRRRAAKAAIVERIADLSGFDKAKKKSRATPYGVYGSRHTPERFEVVDEVKLFNYAKEFAPKLITLSNPKPQQRVLVADAEPHFRKLLAEPEQEGKEIDKKAALESAGVRIVPEFDKPFFKLTVST